MKKTWAFLFLFLFSMTAFASLPWEVPNNDLKFGDGSNTSNKSFEMKMGLGASNPIFSSLNGTEMKVNIPFRVEADLTIGDGTAVDRSFIVDRGGANPYIKWDEASGAFVFSNDGSLDKKIGSGGGGGGGGVNFIKNNSFEDPGSPILNWTAFGAGTLSQETHTNGRENNLKFARYIATGSGEGFISDEVTISDDVGPGCEAQFMYNQGDNAYEYKVLKSPYADPADVVSSGTIADLTDFDDAPVIRFGCVGGDLFKFKIVSIGAGTIDADGEVYLGSNRGGVNIDAMNSFTARIANNGTASIISQNTDAFSSPSRDSLGVVTLDISSSGATVIPSVTASNESFSRSVSITAISLTSVTLTTVSDVDGTLKDEDFSINLQLQGVDAAKTLPAFTPEQADFLANGARGYISGANLTAVNNGVPNSSALTLTVLQGSMNITCSDGSQGGATCSTGNEQSGIEINVPITGIGEVCFQSGIKIDQANFYGSINSYTNGTDSIIINGKETLQRVKASGASSFSSARICERFEINTIGVHTYKIGTLTSDASIAQLMMDGTNNQNGVFTFTMLGYNTPRPILNNMVDTSVKSGVRVENCKINNNGTATPDTSSGLCESWVFSSTRTSAGVVEIVPILATFPNSPVCSCTTSGITENLGGCGLFTEETPTLIKIKTELTTGTDSDIDFNIKCTGKR